MFQKILVAIDDSDNHRAVFTGALDLAQKTNARLMLMHVLSPAGPINPALPTVFTGYYPTVSEELIKIFQEEQQMHEDRGLAMLQSLTNEAMTAGITTEFTQNRGEPGRLICTIAKDWGADLVVVGRRGHSGLSELLLGSVSNHVLHHAPCAVLVIPNPAEGKSETSAENEKEATVAEQ